MSVWEYLQLGYVASINRSVVAPERIDPDSPCLGLEDIEPGGKIHGVRPAAKMRVESNKFVFSDSDVLFGKLRPYLVKIARPSFGGVCSTDILPIAPGEKIDRGYLAHFLTLPSTIALATARSTGANLPRISTAKLARFIIPVPPLDEQRRIAEVLDQVEALRERRRKVIALLDELAESIFLDMFGGLNNYCYGWDSCEFEKLLVERPRNGLSPSKSGQITCRVLTLSAVTGHMFNESAVKSSTFKTLPLLKQTVDARDFLVARGNGNISLLGRGFFPTRSMPDTVFPDIIIASRIDNSKLVPEFLEFVWRSPGVRRQIEAMARTTNGTYKINQSALESVVLPNPPLQLQKKFAEYSQSISSQRKRAVAHLAELDALFSSLQSRAFRGQLWQHDPKDRAGEAVPGGQP